MRRVATPLRIVLALVAAIALVGFVVSPALGGPGFLTKKEASRIFLKKKQAKKLLGKAEAAQRFLGAKEASELYFSRPEADARFLRPEGETRITVGPQNFVPEGSSGGVTTTYFADAAKFEMVATAERAFVVSPSVPQSILGHQTKLAAVEYCYDATSPNATLKAVFAEPLTQSAGGSGGEPGPALADAAARDDSACRTLRPSSPIPIGTQDMLELGYLVEYVGPGTGDFLAGRTTFVLEP